ncbi:hypothetical protein SAMN05443549_109106 [Flavobacterium fluvii]|uniref:Uncharacterized protein n=1 Tax=Flavobacterium fluvii TaxID=468056 RepID=A0A1M5P8M4_9FLAO|nr:hypothetical protein SAMN05443549_109106 [Flavobacterium fluvii]
MWYDIDYKKLAVLLLPTFLRKPVLTAYLQALLVPISQLHYTWLQKRLDDWYVLNHTGKVFSLRNVLNDKLDVASRRIYITDGNAFPRKYIYTRAEKKPVFLGKLFIYQNSEYLNTGVDFIVFVPQEVIDTKINELHSQIRKYKLASKRYQIRPI